MKKIIILTSDGIRHTFLRKAIDLNANIQVLKSYCEKHSNQIYNYAMKMMKIFSKISMNKEQLKIMHENGMILGSHSVNHCVFSKLANEEQEKEIHDSFNFLEKTIGKLHTKIFYYHYGGFHTFTDFTQKILKDSNCNFSFNVESRDITPNDLIKQPQALPRYDCNEFSFGQSNLG